MQDDRLRIWIEQGNVTISQLFFTIIKVLVLRFRCDANHAFDRLQCSWK